MPETQPSYAGLVTQRSPSQLLHVALSGLAGAPGRALDLGAGTFANAQHLLRLGFEVHGVDSDPVACYIARKIEAEQDRLLVSQADIRDIVIEKDSYDLIVALHILPFLSLHDIERLTADIYRGLRPGGVVCCTLIGQRDSWAGTVSTALSESQIDELFVGLSPVYAAEREWDGADAEKKPKHWHLFEQVRIRSQPRGVVRPRRVETRGRVGHNYSSIRLWS